MAREAQSWADEQATVEKFKNVGVLVSAGRGYHCPEKEIGWIRVGFAVEKSRLEEALRRAESIYVTNATATSQ
jgi:aspartate/methionine/tyrosine aminotransferase